MRTLALLCTLALLSGCQTSDGQPYDLGARMQRAAAHLKDKPRDPTVIIIRE